LTKAELIEYISARNFAVISTISEDFPESAAIEFGNDGLTLIFDTSNTSRKFQNIQQSPKVSVVIGWEDERTVQYEGLATLLSGKELSRLKQVYFKKSPDAQKWEHTEGNVYFKVDPVWIRYTDLNVDPWAISVFKFGNEAS
jgi:nitroimidazol reductase NimA-like FMN-containing flavoprotein (pyridoxamine 5'-phosphate oxidase superfamily)